MTDDFVTRAELQETLKVMEERVGVDRAAFEKRMEDRMKGFISEVNGHVIRISEEAHNGRRDLIESNQALVAEFKRTQGHMDRAEEGASRHRESTAARLKTMEAGFDKLKDSVIVAIKDLGKQVGDVRDALEGKPRRRP